MKGISRRGPCRWWALALLGGLAGSAGAAAEASAEQAEAQQAEAEHAEAEHAEAQQAGTQQAEALERFGEVMLAKGRNEQCKVLDETRTRQFDEDVAAILKKLQKRVPARQLLGVALNAAVATGAPESAAGCDEATRRRVEAGSDEAGAWAEELRGKRSRRNPTQQGN